eukprot:3932422-Rhodomonas_salina.1
MCGVWKVTVCVALGSADHLPLARLGGASSLRRHRHCGVPHPRAQGHPLRLQVTPLAPTQGVYAVHTDTAHGATRGVASLQGAMLTAQVGH